MKIILIISLVLVVGLLISNGCIPVEEEKKTDDTSELNEMDQDLNPDNLGNIDKEIDETINW